MGQRGQGCSFIFHLNTPSKGHPTLFLLCTVDKAVGFSYLLEYHQLTTSSAYHTTLNASISPEVHISLQSTQSTRAMMEHSGSVGQAQPVKLSGSFSLSSEQYGSNGIRARRPSGTSRAILQPTITLFDQIILPFEVYLSSEERGFRQPFNQFGVSPRLFGWLTLHAAYYSARLSELTFGDTRLLGGASR